MLDCQIKFTKERAKDHRVRVVGAYAIDQTGKSWTRRYYGKQISSLIKQVSSAGTASATLEKET